MLEIKKGGGCLGCIGIPFMVVGLLMLSMTLQIVPVSNADEITPGVWLIMGLMALVALGVGLFVTFGRTWINLNSSNHRIWVARGLLRPMWGHSYDSYDYLAVQISHNAGDSDTPESFPIALIAKSGSQLDLCSFQNYKDSREQGLLIAEFLDMKLIDRSTNKDLDLSQSEEGLKPSFKTNSGGMTYVQNYPGIEVLRGDDRLHIGILSSKLYPLTLLEIAIPVGLFVFFGPRIQEFFVRSHTPAAVSYFFGGFYGLFFILFPLIAVINKLRARSKYSSELILDMQGIYLKSIYRNKPVEKSITWDKVIDIDLASHRLSYKSLSQNTAKPAEYSYDPNSGEVGPNVPKWLSKFSRFAVSRGICIKTKEGLHYFGAGLKEAYITDLYRLLREYVSAKDENKVAE